MRSKRASYDAPRSIGAALVACALLAGLAGCGTSASPEARNCENLRNFKLENAAVESAQAQSAGRVLQWRTALNGMPFFTVPSSCRIHVVSTPSSDSHIEIEVWLPLTDWNGKFQGLGNGGLAGSIDKMALALALQKGYAAASTDTGHGAGDRDGSWALGHIEKIRDYGYRAIHETAVIAKTLMSAFYGKSPTYSFFVGTSNGGRQGLMEAQRYPTDYDGVVAGCPVVDPSGVLPMWAWLQQSINETATAYVPPEKLKTIAAAVNQSCDAKDGLKDGVIDDPHSCHFDPAVLQCRSGDADSCLTPPQVQSLRNIYSGPPARSTAEPRLGFEPGAELGGSGWQEWLTGSGPGKSVQHVYALEFYRYFVYSDPQWTLDRFDYTRDQDVMRARLGSIMDATDADLSAFEARGGKLIMFHGWNDPALPPGATIKYFEKIQERMGHDAADKFVRLYMVPGMQHCGGGPGPHSFGQTPPAGAADPHRNVSAALEHWVEDGVAPAEIIATENRSVLKALIAANAADPVRTRPLCAYPKVARWNGNGNVNAAENFSCTYTDP
jgi:Tannase and feruloyl esterase